MKILIVGATSAIATHAAREFAREQRAAFLLAGRSAERLEAVASDLRARGASEAHVWSGDLTDQAAPATVMALAQEKLGGLDLVLIAQGSLSDEKRAGEDAAYRAAELSINLASPMAFCYAAAETLRAQGAGQIALITSVAGVRGRAKLFFYGSAKAALIAFSQGLRASLVREGIIVTELRPGLIETPMTAHLPHGLLSTSAERAGCLCHRAIVERRAIVYIPGYWAIIMTIIRLIPEKLFQRMRF